MRFPRRPPSRPFRAAPPCRPAGRRAFSLNEFLVVAGITLIVSLVFAYLTRDIILRVKVAKVRDEQALLKRALQNYRVDWKDYPPDRRQLGSLLAPTAYLVSLPEDSFSLDRERAPSYLYFRQPGGRLDWVVVSPGPDQRLDFRPMVKPPRALAAAPRGTGWEAEDDEPRDHGAAFALLATPTPAPRPPAAGDDDPNRGHPSGGAFDDAEAFRCYLASITYDPTNGAMSAGDLITVPEW